MIQSVDKYLNRSYNRDFYSCLDFARDVWLDHTGIDIRERLSSLFAPVQDRRLCGHIDFKRSECPVDPCLVVMQRKHAIPHVGVYLRGRVLHIVEHGVEYLPLDVASRGFATVRFYLPC